MNVLAITEFVGRLHPVLVHLPIGILLLACCFQLFSGKYPWLKPAIGTMVFWGALSAAAACVTGYFLSLEGGYDEERVTSHQWLGISTAIVAALYWGGYTYFSKTKWVKMLSVLIIIMISVTGHLGGSLTHGADYLTAGASEDGAAGPLPPIPDIQEAGLYADVVRPVLEHRCYSCHGPDKQKGKLRLDEAPFIMKGGKEGRIIVAGKPDESELIKRLLLPLDDDDHMPPKEKPQLSANETAVLGWWISTGSSFTKKVKELPQDAKIKPVLNALQSGAAAPEASVTAEMPEADVTAANERDLAKLKEAGIMIVPVSRDKNYLSANFVTAGNNAAELVKLLEPVKKQLVWLKLDDSNIADAGLEEIGKLTNLTRLHLSNTSISDAGIAKLKALRQLQLLNLTGTKVTEKGVEQLKTIETLRVIYLYQTNVNKASWEHLKKVFPKTELDSGGYVVPILATDTTLVTAESAQ